MKHVQECNDSLRTPCLTSKHFSKVNSSLSHVWATFRLLSSMLVATGHCFFLSVHGQHESFTLVWAKGTRIFTSCFAWTQASQCPGKSSKTLEFFWNLENPGKPWDLTKISKNPWKTLEYILSDIFSFLSLRLEPCFIYYPVI